MSGFNSSADGDFDRVFMTSTDFIELRLDNNGLTYGWGVNTYGDFGNNTANTTPVTSNYPIRTADTYGYSDISRNSANFSTFAAGIRNGYVYSWGGNSFGELGDGTTTARSSPVSVIPGAGTSYTNGNYKQVSAGKRFACAVKTDGSLYCWGENQQYQLGAARGNANISNISPVAVVPGAIDWKQVSCGTVCSAAIKTDATLWIWGSNQYGQIGNNTASTYSSPVTIVGGGSWKAISVGDVSIAGIKTDGTLWAWGQNPAGLLGTNNTSSYSSPMSVAGNGTNWKQISCGQSHTAAIKTDGTLWTWGTNGSGQLGVNNTSSYSSPIQVTGGGTNWSKVSCGAIMTHAIKTDGTLWACGYNGASYPLLGDGTSVNKSSFIQTGSPIKWRKVASGFYTTTGIGN